MQQDLKNCLFTVAFLIEVLNEANGEGAIQAFSGYHKDDVTHVFLLLSTLMKSGRRINGKAPGPQFLGSAANMFAFPRVSYLQCMRRHRLSVANNTPKPESFYHFQNVLLSESWRLSCIRCRLEWPLQQSPTS